MPMDVRLEQLVSSFQDAYRRYALARLEYALEHPAKPAPPLVDPFLEGSDAGLRAQAPEIEMQLDSALAFAARLERARRRKRTTDRAFRSYAQALRELDRAARAIRWVLTVTETHYDL
jgi:hypothetical protein